MTEGDHMPFEASEAFVAGTVGDSLGQASLHEMGILINGEWDDFEVGRDIEPSHTLAHLPREKLGLTGLRVACDEGACGACTALIDGQAVLSCMTLVVEADGHDVLTTEGLEGDDPVVEAFAEQCEPGYGTALKCGICTPGFVMAAKGLLNENPHRTLEEIKEALSGNLCRCGCYAGIAQPVLRAAAPEEIADAVLLLASDASDFITGHSLYVDGGYLCV